MYNDTIEMFLSDLSREGITERVYKSDLLKVIRVAEGDPMNENGSYNKIVYPTRLYQKQGRIYCRFLEYINEINERRLF